MQKIGLLTLGLALNASCAMFPKEATITHGAQTEFEDMRKMYPQQFGWDDILVGYKRGPVRDGAPKNAHAYIIFSRKTDQCFMISFYPQGFYRGDTAKLEREDVDREMCPAAHAWNKRN